MTRSAHSASTRLRDTSGSERRFLARRAALENAQSKGRSDNCSALCRSKRLAQLLAQTQRDELEGDFAKCLAQLVAGRRVEEVR
jgi:hypothetical protein